MKTWARRIALGLGITSAVALGGWFGRKVPVAEQWPLFEALRTTAAIIFAVIGAWMAIIYPERLKEGFKAVTSAETGQSNDGWRQLFTPVVHSTFILGLLLVLGALLPLFRHSAPPLPTECMRGAMFALLVLLTIWQVWTVLMTLWPADKVKTAMDEAQAREQLVRGQFRLAARREDEAANKEPGAE